MQCVNFEAGGIECQMWETTLNPHSPFPAFTSMFLSSIQIWNRLVWFPNRKIHVRFSLEHTTESQVWRKEKKKKKNGDRQISVALKTGNRQFSPDRVGSRSTLLCHCGNRQIIYRQGEMASSRGLRGSSFVFFIPHIFQMAEMEGRHL
jgi:hypothetical protein